MPARKTLARRRAGSGVAPALNAPSLAVRSFQARHAVQPAIAADTAATSRNALRSVRAHDSTHSTAEYAESHDTGLRLVNPATTVPNWRAAGRNTGRGRGGDVTAGRVRSVNAPPRGGANG